VVICVGNARHRRPEAAASRSTIAEIAEQLVELTDRQRLTAAAALGNTVADRLACMAKMILPSSVTRPRQGPRGGSYAGSAQVHPAQWVGGEQA
jgi:hypothetical protein